MHRIHHGLEIDLIMIRFVLLCVFLTTVWCAVAQERLQYETTVDFSGDSAELIYHRVKKWMIGQIKDEPMNSVVAEDFFAGEGVLYCRLFTEFEFETLTSNVTSKVAKIPLIGKKMNSVNELTNAGLNGNISGDFIFTVTDGQLKVESVNFIHTSNSAENSATLSQGLIYKEMPSALMLLDKTQYVAMHTKALPLIQQWWNRVVEAVSALKTN